ncbi:hypothetical protein AWB74_07697 [Caballeronia arvi]|uniref:BioF2-like acetyltransferase domain-containing protein n=1 Tax=Caballeronia arvi TaxID=1777135 RepID=A0A158L0B8_9BURK|nr:hypothetical protein AWB74_07697 [Caballeronia arvi]
MLKKNVDGVVAIPERPRKANRHAPPLPLSGLCPSASSLEAQRSIFHEAWWLDIASGGRWALAQVEESGTIVGEMPYYLPRKGIWQTCINPPLTRTLGPLILDTQQSPTAEFQHRVSVTNKLIEQLPRVDKFFQVFDPRIRDAVAFSLNGYNVSLGFTFRISFEQTCEDAWLNIRKYTRNLIEKAEKRLTVGPIYSVDDFLNFYAANLADRRLRNAYNERTMRSLVEAFTDRKAGIILGAYSTTGSLEAAVGLVWDRRTMYYLLTTRAQTAHSGSISLLIWKAIQIAIQRKLILDLDGIASPTIYRFLSSFGGYLEQRIEAEKISTGYALVQTLHRRFFSSTSQGSNI